MNSAFKLVYSENLSWANRLLFFNSNDDMGEITCAKLLCFCPCPKSFLVKFNQLIQKESYIINKGTNTTYKTVSVQANFWSLFFVDYPVVFYIPEIVLTILQIVGKTLFVICTKLENQKRTVIKFWLILV